MLIYGSDEKEYLFLLKGHEDLRQDERVMQLLKLVNKLLASDLQTEALELQIMTYNVIPLAMNTGLCEWVHFCDPLQTAIKEYRL